MERNGSQYMKMGLVHISPQENSEIVNKFIVVCTTVQNKRRKISFLHSLTFGAYFKLFYEQYCPHKDKFFVSLIKKKCIHFFNYWPTCNRPKVLKTTFEQPSRWL